MLSLEPLKEICHRIKEPAQKLKTLGELGITTGSLDGIQG